MEASLADIGAANWNEADNSNTSAAPDGAPEGMAPSGVNDVLRAHQGAVKRWYDWSIPKTTGGTSTAYTLNYTVAPAAYVDGMTFLVQFYAINGLNPTLNVNSLGAIPLTFYCGGAWSPSANGMPPYMIGVDQVVRVAYHQSSGTFRCVDLDPVLTLTQSAASTFDFSGIPSNVNNISIEGSVTPSGTDVLAARFFGSGGSIDSTGVYYTTGAITQEGSVSGINSTAATGINLTGWTGTLSVGMELNIKGAQRVARTPFEVSAAGSNGTPGIADFHGGGFRLTDGPITGARIYCVSGATLTGTLTARLS